jgi:hypothetical protein
MADNLITNRQINHITKVNYININNHPIYSKDKVWIEIENPNKKIILRKEESIVNKENRYRNHQ